MSTIPLLTASSQMTEPTCPELFDFEYERIFGTATIPKDELQKIMFRDMLHFSGTREDSSTDIAERLTRSTLSENKDDREDER